MADYPHLRDSERRRGGDVFVVESRLAVRRLLTSRYRLRSLLLTESALRGLGPELSTLPDEAPVYLASRELLNRIVGFDLHRGCAAAAERGEPARPDALLAGASVRGPARLMGLHEVANPENVGSSFRNALAFGCAGVLLSRGCADPLYRKAIRVSMGASLHLPFAHYGRFDQLAAAARSAGFRVLALVTAGDAPELRSFGRERSIPERALLVVGSEGDGLGEEVLACADDRVRIAMAAGVDSLNLATAAAIALHHLATAP